MCYDNYYRAFTTKITPSLYEIYLKVNLDHRVKLVVVVVVVVVVVKPSDPNPAAPNYPRQPSRLHHLPCLMMASWFMWVMWAMRGYQGYVGGLWWPWMADLTDFSLQPVISNKTETALTASADQNTSTSASKTNTAFYTWQTMIAIINTSNP